ncbi:MAG TPA: trehalose-phosphatase, partial [Terriglobales bacterium]|nr:trehalose-phosphatase [Terriglobales bacterium]
MVPQWLHPIRHELAGRMADASHLLLLLDYDGTLAPIAPTPEQALPLPGTAELLTLIAAQPSVTLAIITGRAIRDL